MYRSFEDCCCLHLQGVAVEVLDFLNTAERTSEFIMKCTFKSYLEFGFQPSVYMAGHHYTGRHTVTGVGSFSPLLGVRKKLYIW